MKNLILYTIILIISVFALDIFAQSNMEKARAEFLTSYYKEVNNFTNTDDIIDSNDLEISVNQMIEEDNSKGTANLIVDRRRLEIVSANCLHSLRTENEGVVESAIFVSIQFKNRFPDSNDEKFVDALNELVKYSPSPVISYKAHLAKLYFESTDLFNDIDVSSILDEERVYSDISDRINRLRLSASLN